VLNGFKKFIMRGNVVDLAVGIVIGAAFTLVINSFVNDVLMAIIGAIFGKPTFNDLTFTIGDGVVYYGRFLTALVSFIITAAALYLVVVAPLNYFNDRRKAKRGEPEELTNEERMIELLEQIAAKS
jgi:large conductance mechanosensitive channel